MNWTTPSGTSYNLYQSMLNKNHLLIGGATGSGKSVLINALIYEALFKSPNNVGLILCDPKMVELSKYARLPHVIKYADTLPGICESLQIAHNIMMNRFTNMKRRGQVETTERDIYVIVDEFADLVTRGADRIENSLKKACEACIESIGKLGRAAHVHLILATQAPNRQVIKANIALNMTARVALRCEFATESRQIIGIPDAIKLPDPKEAHRAEGYYKHGLKTELYNIPMIPAEKLTARVEWWEKQKPIGFFARLFKKSA